MTYFENGRWSVNQDAKKIWVKDRRVKGGGYWREGPGNGSPVQKGARKIKRGVLKFFSDFNEENERRKQGWDEVYKVNGGKTKYLAKATLFRGAPILGTTVGAGLFLGKQKLIEKLTEAEKKKTGDIDALTDELVELEERLHEKRRGPTSKPRPKAKTYSTPEDENISPGGYRMRKISQDSLRLDAGKTWVKDRRAKGGGYWRRNGKRIAKELFQESFGLPKPPKPKKISNKLLVGLSLASGGISGVSAYKQWSAIDRAASAEKDIFGKPSNPRSSAYKMSKYAEAKKARKESDRLKQDIEHIKSQLKEKIIYEEPMRALPPSRSDSVRADILDRLSLLLRQDF